MHKSPLHEFHVSCGAKMVEFAGWEMPIHYGGIRREHLHTRTKLSVFDVSHMGRIRIRGDGASLFLQRICTRDLSDTSVHQSKYSHVCNQDGKILDDVIISRHDDHWMMICNAANREKILAWLGEHAAEGEVQIDDQTFDTAMLAIQGPEAVGFVESNFGLEIDNLKRYWFIDGEFLGIAYTIYRSGYTGEDGVEAVVPAGAVSLMLPLLFGDDSSAASECKPAGLAARDTLRLEAAMPLYGHELHEGVDPISAGQGWCVQLENDFIGCEAMRKIHAEGPKRKLVGLQLEGQRIARQGQPIQCDGRIVGEITSGTMSPTLEKSIAMGYVEASTADKGTRVSIDLGRKEASATIVPLPFYKRPKRN